MTVSEPVSSVPAKLSEVSASGRAVLQMRSPLLSARRPQKIMNTEAMPNGIMFRRPVSRLPRPKLFRICGIHSDSVLLVAELPA